MDLAVALALLLASAAGACVYLASPHQRWRAAPLPALPARAAALALASASLAAFTRALDPVAAVLSFVSLSMLLAVALPYSSALLGAQRSER